MSSFEIQFYVGCAFMLGEGVRMCVCVCVFEGRVEVRAVQNVWIEYGPIDKYD